MTTDQNTRGRREFLAAVALTNLPMPLRVAFRAEAEAASVREEVTLVLDSIAMCRTWAQALGVDLGATWRDGGEDVACGYGQFAGRLVCLIGRDPVSAPEPALTGATRDRLEALTRQVA